MPWRLSRRRSSTSHRLSRSSAGQRGRSGWSAASTGRGRSRSSRPRGRSCAGRRNPSPTTPCTSRLPRWPAGSPRGRRAPYCARSPTPSARWRSWTRSVPSWAPSSAKRWPPARLPAAELPRSPSARVGEEGCTAYDPARAGGPAQGDSVSVVRCGRGAVVDQVVATGEVLLQLFEGAATGVRQVVPDEPDQDEPDDEEDEEHHLDSPRAHDDREAEDQDAVRRPQDEDAQPGGKPADPQREHLGQADPDRDVQGELGGSSFATDQLTHVNPLSGS